MNWRKPRVKIKKISIWHETKIQYLCLRHSENYTFCKIFEPVTAHNGQLNNMIGCSISSRKLFHELYIFYFYILLYYSTGDNFLAIFLLLLLLKKKGKEKIIRIY